MLALEAKVRDANESTDALRASGAVPAVLYGPKEPATPVSINARELEHVWREAGETTIVTVKGVGDDKDTLIHDVQFHPVTSQLLHADFYVLEKGKKITIKVPLEFKGAAPAEKAGHIVVKAMHEVEIEVAPQELPHHLAVDLGVLAGVGDHITASQIILPPSASLLTQPDEIVASVTEFKEEPTEITPAPETIITTQKPAEGAEGETATAEKGDKSAQG